MKKSHWLYIAGTAVLCAVILFIIILPRQHFQSNIMEPGKKAKYMKSNILPQPDHIVIAVEENHSGKQILGNSEAPYINSLAENGAYFTNMHALTHPSQPNYIALFSGSGQNVRSDKCPYSFSAPNLASELKKAGKSFAGYSEGLPFVGFAGCTSGTYARKHNPWVNFKNVPSSANQPFSRFPKDFSKLPAVSFVIPNLDHDMHNGTIKEADQWLQKNLDSYIKWANKNNSLFILIWDEDDGSNSRNKIPAVFAGENVKKGKYNRHYNLYSILRTIEDMYGLPALKYSQYESPIMGVWKQ